MFSSHAGGAESFFDVGDDHWAYEEVAHLLAEDVIEAENEGSTAFAVNDNITRAEAAVFLYRALDVEPDDEEDHHSFTDLAEADFGYEEVQSLVRADVFDRADAFHPEDELTRAEMARIFASAFQLTKESTVPFRDVFQDDWFYPYVQSLLHEGVTSGDGNGAFLPDDSLTKAEFAVFLTRLTDDDFKVDGQKQVTDAWEDKTASLADELNEAVVDGVAQAEEDHRDRDFADVESEILKGATASFSDRIVEPFFYDYACWGCDFFMLDMNGQLFDFDAEILDDGDVLIETKRLANHLLSGAHLEIVLTYDDGDWKIDTFDSTLPTSKRGFDLSKQDMIDIIEDSYFVDGDEIADIEFRESEAREPVESVEHEQMIQADHYYFDVTLEGGGVFDVVIDSFHGLVSAH
nr:S-layer homology domain-containing protein [Texcoconibacillus texcoconensis]